MLKVNLNESFATLKHWGISQELCKFNGRFVRGIKLKGILPWHNHQDKDTMILVIKGCLRILLRDREFVLNSNEFGVIPKGIDHAAMAEPEAWVLAVE